MRDVTVAPKLAALKDLLTQCGVIGEGGDDGTSGVERDLISIRVIPAVPHSPMIHTN